VDRVAEAETRPGRRVSFGVMRWLGAWLFFLVAVGLGVLAVGSLGAVFSSDTDTAEGVLIGQAVVLLLLAAGSVFGGLWVLRNWPPRSP
jgi:hypothetical protein